MSGFWTAWARSLGDLTPTAKLVTAELALLADARGVAIAPVSHLMETTGRTAKAIREALASVEGRGLIRRPAELNPRRPFRGIRVQLIAHPKRPTSSEPTRVLADPEPQPPVSVQGASLRALLEDCAASDWSAPATWRLATLIEEQGEDRFAAVVRRRQRHGTAQDPWDTLTLAWETAQSEAPTILESRDPWAMWIYLTDRACLKEDRESAHTVLVSAENVLESIEFRSPAPVREDSPVFGVDDFDDALRDLVLLLVRTGVPEAVAWAGTARILELVEAGPSRRHWLAGRDAKLQGLGIGERAARAWMTLVAGSRRGAGGILTAGFGDRADTLASEIGEAYSDQALQLLPAG